MRAPGATAAVNLLTRANGKRSYIIHGDFGDVVRKADWDAAMADAWQALEIVQTVRRNGPGRPFNTGRYPDVASLVAELDRFVSVHGRLPRSKAEFIREAGSSRETLNTALSRFGITWEQALNSSSIAA